MSIFPHPHIAELMSHFVPEQVDKKSTAGMTDVASKKSGHDKSMKFQSGCCTDYML